MDWSSPIGRVSYFAQKVFYTILGLILIAVTVDSYGRVTTFGEIISALVFVCVLGAASRRLRDLGRTRWLILLYLVPIVNLLLVLYLTFAPGGLASDNQLRSRV
ncbi:DUF805 domain-containing protein [Falsigemmobacter intermedius]